MVIRKDAKDQPVEIQLSKYFTVGDQVKLRALLTKIKLIVPNCLKCNKEIQSDNFIMSSKSKNTYHPKCVGVSYVPKNGIALKYANKTD